jgi:nitric oxide dioxygenase
MGAAYWQLANILIGAEGAEYDRLAAAPGGWRGARAFRIAHKVVESAEITSFTLAPVDGGPVLAHQPGQYLGLRLTVEGQEVRRNYSLSEMANGRTLRISVKREPGGVVSNHLHGLAEGAVVDVFPPAGEFVLKPGTHPLVLISGGVGITPTLAMAQAALGEGERDVIVLHYARNPRVQAFGPTIADWRRDHPRLTAHVVFEEGAPDGAPSGRPTLEQLRGWVPVEGEAYVLGPKPFMGFVKRALAQIGLPAERCHHEFFGPAEALD